MRPRRESLFTALMSKSEPARRALLWQDSWRFSPAWATAGNQDGGRKFSEPHGPVKPNPQSPVEASAGRQ